MAARLQRFQDPDANRVGQRLDEVQVEAELPACPGISCHQVAFGFTR
jgi:hypothetical protein